MHIDKFMFTGTLLESKGWGKLSSLFYFHPVKPSHFRSPLEPIKNSQIELSSKVFNHFTNYTALTAFSMNSAADVKLHFVSVGGDFSFEKDVVRKAEARFGSYNTISLMLTAFK